MRAWQLRRDCARWCSSGAAARERCIGHGAFPCVVSTLQTHLHPLPPRLLRWSTAGGWRAARRGPQRCCGSRRRTPASEGAGCRHGLHVVAPFLLGLLCAFASFPVRHVLTPSLCCFAVTQPASTPLPSKCQAKVYTTVEATLLDGSAGAQAPAQRRRVVVHHIPPYRCLIPNSAQGPGTTSTSPHQCGGRRCPHWLLPAGGRARADERNAQSRPDQSTPVTPNLSAFARRQHFGAGIRTRKAKRGLQQNGREQWVCRRALPG